uniref:Uncharacterized protein n=1 Tax=Kalanchoe fedtschenkoi TaxID=63787 RepID=A0A7N0TVH8_KALFE
MTLMIHCRLRTTMEHGGLSSITRAVLMDVLPMVKSIAPLNRIACSALSTSCKLALWWISDILNKRAAIPLHQSRLAAVASSWKDWSLRL